MDSTRKMRASDLQTALGLSNSNPPPKDSYFWRLWEANKATANQVLNSKFVQGIKQGNLDQRIYQASMLNCEYFNVSAEKVYKDACQRADISNKDLQKYLKLRSEECAKYKQSTGNVWHFNDNQQDSSEKNMKPMQVTQDYVAHESDIVTNYDPMYALIVMLPRAYLWAWIGQQLSPSKPGAGYGPDNQYKSWITENNNPDCAFLMGNFIEKYTNSINYDKALKLYTKSIQYELELLRNLWVEYPSNGSGRMIMNEYSEDNFQQRNFKRVQTDNNETATMTMMMARMEVAMMKQEAMMMKHEAAMMKQEAAMMKMEASMAKQMAQQETALNSQFELMTKISEKCC